MKYKNLLPIWSVCMREGRPYLYEVKEREGT